MNVKEFDRLQTAVQWAVDEARRTDLDQRWLTHDQGKWGYGTVENREPIKAKYGLAPITMRAVCPSACCLAGNIVLAEGDTFVVPTYSSHSVGEEVNVDYCVDTKGTVYKIEDRALDLIGMEYDQQMFDSEQDIDDLVETVGEVVEAHGFTLDIK